MCDGLIGRTRGRAVLVGEGARSEQRIRRQVQTRGRVRDAGTADA